MGHGYSRILQNITAEAIHNKRNSSDLNAFSPLNPNSQNTQNNPHLNIVNTDHSVDDLRRSHSNYAKKELVLPQLNQQIKNQLNTLNMSHDGASNSEGEGLSSIKEDPNRPKM
jgi:hypothetical protein